MCHKSLGYILRSPKRSVTLLTTQNRDLPPCASDSAFADIARIYIFHLLTYLVSFNGSQSHTPKNGRMQKSSSNRKAELAGVRIVQEGLRSKVHSTQPTAVNKTCVTLI